MSTAIVKTPDPKPWSWTKQRREAAQLVVDGWTDKAIAEKLGFHKNTIFNWRHTPEFVAECKRLLEEYAARTRLKRIRSTGRLTDSIEVRLAEAITSNDTNKVSVYGKEFHAMRNEERIDFGDNVQRIEGKLSVHGQIEQSVNHSGSVSFKDFLDKHADVIDVTPVLEAAKESPEKALMEMSIQVLQKTDIMERIHEEDKAAEHEAANRHE